MNIKLKNKHFPFFTVFFALVITCSSFISCKSTSVNYDKDARIFYKVVHPREYYFDLFEDGESQKFKKDKKTKKLEYTIDFTKIVEKDMPKAGDKLIFQYRFCPSKDVKGNVYASLDIPLSFTKQRLIGSNLEKDKIIQGQVSFILDKDIEEVKLNIKLDTVQKSSWLYFDYEEFGNTTNINQEMKEFAKAKRNKFTILDKFTEIQSDYDDEEVYKQSISEVTSQKISTNVPEVNKEKADTDDNCQVKLIDSNVSSEQNKNNQDENNIKTNSELIIEDKHENIENKNLEKENIEADKKVLEEKNKQDLELKKQQQILEETIKTVANTNVTRYEKEYLDDYAVEDYTFDMDVNVKRNPTVFPDPNLADDFGRTLLMEAARTGNDWQIKALVNANADVNKQDKDGWTALMYAVRYQGNMDCVDLLINAGADIKITNNYGMSALLIASNYNNNPEIIKKLLSYYNSTDKDVLKAFVLVLTDNSTAEFMQLFKINLFLNMSVPLNSFYQGKTPLMYAAESGSSNKVIQLLLDNNSITSIRSSEGKTAFDYAKENPKLKHDETYWSLNNK